MFQDGRTLKTASGSSFGTSTAYLANKTCANEILCSSLVRRILLQEEIERLHALEHNKNCLPHRF